MGFFGDVRRQLKRRFRLKRRWLSLGIIFMFIGCGLLAYSWAQANESGLALTKESFAILPQPAAPEQIKRASEVIVQRVYVCGEEKETLGRMTPEEIIRIAESHPDWDFEVLPDDSVKFVEQVDDLSEQCKLESYIGVDAEGNLTLYRGLPGEEQAVRTFFQLDIEHLESALPEEAVRQLREGIRITDISEYKSVISTFSDFAVEETQKVMKPGMSGMP